jgi:hypothetical protein
VGETPWRFKSSHPHLSISRNFLVLGLGRVHTQSTNVVVGVEQAAQVVLRIGEQVAVGGVDLRD